MRAAILLRSWYGAAMVMRVTSNLSSAMQPHSSYEDNGLGATRKLQDCGTCMEDVFTDDGTTSCPVCLQVISDCLAPFEDDSYYGAVGLCTPCGSISTSDLKDFYADLCGELSDITEYTVENCWSYLVPSCPDDTTDDYSTDSFDDSTDDYSTDSFNDYTYDDSTDSFDDYTYDDSTDSFDDYTYDDSTDSFYDYTVSYTTDYTVSYTTEDDFGASADDGTDDFVDSSDDSVVPSAGTTDDDPVEPVEPSSNNGRVCVCRSSGGYLAIAVLTVLLSSWTR